MTDTFLTSPDSYGTKRSRPWANGPHVTVRPRLLETVRARPRLDAGFEISQQQQQPPPTLPSTKKKNISLQFLSKRNSSLPKHLFQNMLFRLQ